MTVNFKFPEIEVVKTTTASGFPDVADAQVGQSFGWRIVINNNATTAQAVDTLVEDTLPPGWTYDAGSASITGATTAEPTVSPSPSGDGLTWDFTGQTIQPGASVVITFTATPGLDARANPPAQTNSAEASSKDASGSGTNASGPYSDDDTAQATLLFPELTVEKTPDDGTVDAGAAMDWTIVVRNVGTGIATDVKVEDDLPAGMTYQAGTATASPSVGFSEVSVTPDPNDGSTPVETVWDINSIPAGGSVTITYPVTALASLADGTKLVNTVDVTAFEQPEKATDTGDVSITIAADLKASKSFDPANPVAGEQFTYTVGVENLGPSDATGVKITDPLPPETTFVSAPGCTESSGTVECVVGDLAVGDKEEFVVTVKLAPDAGAVSNTATVSGTTPDPNPDNDTATVNFDAVKSADLKASKSFDPANPVAGEQFTYTVGVENLGPSDATGVKITDPLPPETTFVSAPGCTESSGTVECVVGDLAVGDKEEFVVTVKLAPDAGAVSNTATVSGTTPDPNPDNDTATVNFDAVKRADMAITKDVDPATIFHKENSVFTLVVTNNGPSVAEDVLVQDDLPSGLEYVSDDSGCSESSGMIECSLGDFQPLQSQTIKITVKGEDVGTWNNTATVESTTTDPNPDNNTDSAELVVDPIADLKASKSFDPANPVAGEQFTYTVGVENLGPSDATGVKITDPLPPETTFVSAPGCTESSGTVECVVGDLAVGDKEEFVVTVKLAPDAGAVSNTATVSGTTPDPNPDNDTATVNFDAVKRADMAITKDVDPATIFHKENSVFTLVVTNNGPSVAEDVLVQDDLPSGLEYVSDDSGCSESSGMIECSLGDFQPLQSQTIKITVKGEDVGTWNNTATVESTTTDPNPDNNTDSAELVVDPIADLKITKTAPATASAHQPFTYTMLVENLGPSPATDVVISDPLPPGLDFISSDDCDATMACRSRHDSLRRQPDRRGDRRDHPGSCRNDRHQYGDRERLRGRPES